MMKSLSKYKVLVFDIDNTLYDYFACDKAAYAEVKKYAESRYGLNDYFDVCLNEAKKRVKAKLHDSASSHNRLLYFKSIADYNGLRLKDAIKMYYIYCTAFFEAMKKNTYQDVVDFIKNSKQKICISTDMVCEIQLKKLEVLGICERVCYIITSEENGAEKPDVGMYQSIVNMMNEPAENCLFIGDDKLKDVDGPRRFGMDSIDINDFRRIEK